MGVCMCASICCMLYHVASVLFAGGRPSSDVVHLARCERSEVLENGDQMLRTRDV